MGAAQSGSSNPNWNGGRSVASNGYVLVRVGVNHRLADVRGYAYEHRLIAEQKIGRPLRPGEHVHHVDGNKQNNFSENLEVLTAEEHRAEHRSASTRLKLRQPGEVNPSVECGCGCGNTFAKYDGANRPRSYISGHNPTKTANRDAVLTALREGVQKPAIIAERTGLSDGSVSAALITLRSSGAAQMFRRAHWVACDTPAKRTTPLRKRLVEDLAPVVADAVRDGGVSLTTESNAEIAAALRELARLYESVDDAPSSTKDST